MARDVDENPNTSWIFEKGSWLAYVLCVYAFHVVVAGLPGVSRPLAWAITILAHHAVTFFAWHWVKGTPFGEDQGKYRQLTWWEQLDKGLEFTTQKKFLTIFPLMLFIIVLHLTDYELPLFYPCLVSTLVIVVAKLPFMNRVRILGINSK
eukprot:TRINITY_DN4221_c0_g1_i1.p1 TRINITY_DN4221_c0_g1~~TRINITY_DN4221_c0_g1_i1.p1  ORF type:complete len:170 (-),score=36.78 TRINITY_DN4221_c0_g1_i1:77-526(-)